MCSGTLSRMDGDTSAGTFVAEAPPRQWLADRLRSVPERPVLCTALLGVVFMTIQLWWNLQNRQIGAFNVDEEGGLAAALRFHRSFELGPTQLIRAVFSTSNGPLVPLLSVPILVIGPRTVSAAMTVQSALVVAAACGTAGIVDAIGNRRAAVFAGLVMLLLPASVISSRSYQYSTGVAAFLALALWALLGSDRGRARLPMIAFGGAVGAMLLSRTMSASFVPGLAAGRARRHRPGARGSGSTWRWPPPRPWSSPGHGGWCNGRRSPPISQRTPTAIGLTTGVRSPSATCRDHVMFFVNDFGLLAIVGVFAVAFAITMAAIGAGQRRALGGVAPNWIGSRRSLAAVIVALVLGRLALLSTSNLGQWFAYPLDVTAIASVVGLAAAVPPTEDRRLPRWQRGFVVVGARVPGGVVHRRLDDSCGRALGPDRLATGLRQRPRRSSGGKHRSRPASHLTRLLGSPSGCR